MMDEVISEEDFSTKPFIITFTGGDMDGRVLSNRSDDKTEKMAAEMFLSITKGGEPGHGIQGVSFSAILEDRVSDVVRVARERRAAGKPITRFHAYHSVERKLVDGVYQVKAKYGIVENQNRR